jgi:hypothetical protein
VNPDGWWIFLIPRRCKTPFAMIRTRLTSQRLAFLFLLGCIFFNYPLLSIFNKSGSFLGMPPLLPG